MSAHQALGVCRCGAQHTIAEAVALNRDDLTLDLAALHVLLRPDVPAVTRLNLVSLDRTLVIPAGSPVSLRHGRSGDYVVVQRGGSYPPLTATLAELVGRVRLLAADEVAAAAEGRLIPRHTASDEASRA